MTIQVGDTVEIPKGTEVLEGHTYSDFRHFTYMDSKTSARKNKVKVESIVDVSARWWNLLGKEIHDEVRERTGIHCSTLFDNARGIYPDDNGPITYGANDRIGKRMSPAEVDRWLVGNRQRVPIERQPEIDALFEELKARVVARFGDMKFIVWGDDQRSTLLTNAVPAEAKEKAPKKEQKITKRRLMLAGSKWTFTQDVEINIWVENPEIDRLVKERESYRVDRNSKHQQGSTMVIVLGGGREQTQSELDAMARIQKQIDQAETAVMVKAAVIAKGTRVQITGKPEAGGEVGGWRSKKSNGLMVPMRVIADGPIRVAKQFLGGDRWRNPLWARDGLSLPYSQIEGAMEVEEGSVPEDIVWALRDRESGEYFGGWETERHSYGNRQTNTPKLSPTFSGAKKYKNLSALKASIMDFTGYHAGLEAEGYMEEWVGGTEKKIDLPETWEAVAVDKTTNTPKRTEDVVEWYAGLMRLRVLTAQFGSALRGLYKKVEKKKDDFEAIVVFKLHEDIDEHDAEVAREYRLIEEAVEASGVEKPVRNTTPRAMAFAVPTQMDATLMLLAYQGSGTCKAFDIATLNEIVPEKPE